MMTRVLLAFLVIIVVYLNYSLVLTDTACGVGEIYDYPVKGCVCVSPGNSIRCPVPPKNKCKNFPLDECNMCTCDEVNKRSFTCTLKWC
ncbi:hypothetical protein PVAND_009145 [Polypedilum vanderplanki]|uniref:Protease inhibitor n=1 Tax=Polypedilum vanderplanki TaxID=319348 RepID=A0A9J6CBR5_POLVA|nr:hypothetical protein PVAND_009145 [Polypedilum vanderplanki]